MAPIRIGEDVLEAPGYGWKGVLEVVVGRPLEDGVWVQEHADGGLSEENEGALVVGVGEGLTAGGVALLLEAWLEKVGLVGAEEEALDGEQDLVEGRAVGDPPLAGAVGGPGAQQAETDLALGVEVRMDALGDAADEEDRGRVLRVSRGQMDVKEEEEVLVERVRRAHDHGTKEVAARAPGDQLDGGGQLGEDLPLAAEMAQEGHLLGGRGGDEMMQLKDGGVEEQEGFGHLWKGVDGFKVEFSHDDGVCNIWMMG